MRGPETEVALMAVLDTQEFGPILFPASRFLPQLGRLHRGHQDLDRAARVHLLAHDCLDLAQHAQAERHPGVDAPGELPHESRPQHQSVADHLGLGWVFLERCNEELRSAHVCRRSAKAIILPNCLM